VNKTDLVRIHEARIAHHVAAICQVDGQYSTASIFDRRSPVVMKLFVVVRLLVAARKKSLDVRQEFRIHRHQVFKVSVFGAIFDHPDLAVTFDDLGFDLTNLFIDQRRDIAFAADDLFACFDHAVRAERICLAREAKSRLGFLPRLKDRFIRPFRYERGIWFELIDRSDGVERAGCDVGQSFLKMFYRSHSNNLQQIYFAVSFKLLSG